MSITAVNATYISTAAPVAGGSTTLAFGGQSVQELSYIGTATFTGDGATSIAVLNFIDGVNALSFTPTSVIAFRTGGNTTNTQAVTGTANVTNILCNVLFSAAIGSSNTITITFLILK